MAEPDLISGETGTGKTSALTGVIKYIREVSQERPLCRLITYDNYGLLMPYVEAGQLEVWDLAGYKAEWTLLITRKAAQGYWPNPDKPGQLLEPAKAGWERVGAAFFEGLTSIGAAYLTYFADRVAKGDASVGKAVDAPMWIQEGAPGQADGFKVGGNSQTHYNAIQNELSRLVSMSAKSLPVRKLIWTALEMKGVDKDTGMPMYGPMLVGKAKVSSAPAWFGNYLSFDIDPKTGQHVMYSKKWIEDVLGMKIEHPNKMRLPMVDGKPVGADRFASPAPIDLYKFYKTLDECHGEATRMLGAQVGAAAGGGK